MTKDTILHEQLARLLNWREAHMGFDAAVDGIPNEHRGTRPDGLPYSLWELLEHLRIAQWDILDFCRNPDYREKKWPDDYWPPTPSPPNEKAWDESVEQFRADRAALQDLARDSKIDLGAKIPHGSGQTYLREIILAADHAAFHVGEIVVIRRLLGIWKPR